MVCLIGIVYCLFYIRYKISIDFFKYLTVCSILFVIALIDYKTQDVYFSTTAMATILSVLFIIIGALNGISVKTYIFGGAISLIFSIIMAAFNVIGWGDVEIFLVCGLLAGTSKLLMATFIAVVLSGSYGLYLIITKKDKKNYRVAFGPYIIVSLILTII